MNVTKTIVNALTTKAGIGLSILGVGFGAYFIQRTSSGGTKYKLKSNLKGKTYILTGATSGIGRRMAEELARRDATVLMLYRDRAKCNQSRAQIVQSTRNKNVFCRRCDMSSMESIQRFVTNIGKGKQGAVNIDGLILNAGVIKGKREVSPEGIEMSLATNHMGPFLLTALLLDRFLQSSPRPVRVVTVCPNTIDRNAKIDFDNLNSLTFDKKNDPVNAWKTRQSMQVYKQSKLALALFTYELAQRLKDTNVKVNMADPGHTQTELERELRHRKYFLSRMWLSIAGWFMATRKPTDAVKTLLYVTADPELEGVSGKFFSDVKEIDWNEQALDSQLRRRLWLTSEKWTQSMNRLQSVHKAAEVGAIIESSPSEAAAKQGEDHQAGYLNTFTQYLPKFW